MTLDLSLPSVGLRWYYVWKRHFLVWWKVLGPSVLANFGEPLLYLLALGYGLGMFVGQVKGIDYMAFLATGIVCSNAMNTATFEGMYAAFTRLAMQRTWDAMLAAPLTLDDIVIGEIVWCGTRSVIGCAAIFVVAGFLGSIQWVAFVPVMLVVFLAGLAFGAMALVVTAFAKSYDFFLYYFTLVVTPLMLLSGVFFPLDALPPWIQVAAQAFPLVHAVEIARPLMIGIDVENLLLHICVIAAYIALATYAALVFLRRRMLV
jgi:lipooligosaccharide transport system permease protein